MKYVMWGIKLESLLSPIDRSYLQLFVALGQPLLTYSIGGHIGDQNGGKIIKNKKYVMCGIKLERLLSPIDLSYLQLFVA